LGTDQTLIFRTREHSGASIGVGYAKTVNAEQLAGVLNNYPPAQRQNLAEAAAEIQQLLQQLEQSYPTQTPEERKVFVSEAIKKIESNLPLKNRLVSAMRAGSLEALKKLVQHPAIEILVAAIEGWKNT
jgi:translation initiation factor IF-2